MRETIKDLSRIQHIQKAIYNLERFLEGKAVEDIENESILFYAVVKNLEIIGEAAYMLSKDFISANQEINWQDYIKLRHVMVHGYYTINPKIVFEICMDDIPKLKPFILKYLSNPEGA